MLVRNNPLFSSLSRQTGARAANRPQFSASQPTQIPTNHDEFMKVQANLPEQDRTVQKKRPSGLTISDFPGVEREPGAATSSASPHMASVVGPDGKSKVLSLRSLRSN